jgi:Domain of unknown function (DUF4389)
METDFTQAAYPVRIEVQVPAKFKRVQLLVRLLVLVAIGMIHQSGPSLFGLVYFLLPVVAAVLITQRGGTGYLDRDSRWLVSALEWVVGFYAYMLFVTDTFPLDKSERAVQLQVEVDGHPSVGSALARLLSSLPQLFVLFFVGLVAAVVSMIGAVGILLFESYPEALRSFQQKVVAWLARLFAYHGSLVQKYPPFGFGHEHDSHKKIGTVAPAR